MRKRFIVPITVALLGLSGCTPAVNLVPAEGANNPTCADVIVRLPDTVAGLPRRSTNAQSTGAWGNPAGVILRCGVETPGPSALPCITVDGIDWLRDDSNDPSFLFVTFGRTPAVEVIIDATAASGEPTLSDLSSAVGQIPHTAVCQDSVTTGN